VCAVSNFNQGTTNFHFGFVAFSFLLLSTQKRPWRLLSSRFDNFFSLFYVYTHPLRVFKQQQWQRHRSDHFLLNMSCGEGEREGEAMEGKERGRRRSLCEIFGRIRIHPYLPSGGCTFVIHSIYSNFDRRNPSMML
jgi:hypothetical protein